MKIKKVEIMKGKEFVELVHKRDYRLGKNAKGEVTHIDIISG